MPSDKEHRRAKWREWYAKNPEAQALQREKSRLRRLRIKQEAAPLIQPVPTVSELQILPDKHVVLSKLLHRLLLEAYDRGFLSIDVTDDDTGYELRVRAALTVSRSLVEKSTEESGNHDTGE